MNDATDVMVTHGGITPGLLLGELPAETLPTSSINGMLSPCRPARLYGS